MGVTDVRSAPVTRRPRWLAAGFLAVLAGVAMPRTAGAQTAASRPTGRVSFHVNSDRRDPNDGVGVKLN